MGGERQRTLGDSNRPHDLLTFSLPQRFPSHGTVNVYPSKPIGVSRAPTLLSIGR